MINLLPPELKQNYRYARRNASLLHVIGLFGIGLAGLAVIVAAGLVYLQQTATTYADQAAILESSLQEQRQDEVERDAKEISGSLRLAVQVLSNEILFSELLKRLAVITPSNTTLSGITISDLQGALDITARTTDYTAATQLQVNLTDPGNKIFDKADIVSITCTTADSASADPQAARYPCTAVLRAQFAADNPFLFINNKAGN